MRYKESRIKKNRGQTKRKWKTVVEKPPLRVSQICAYARSIEARVSQICAYARDRVNAQKTVLAINVLMSFYSEAEHRSLLSFR